MSVSPQIIFQFAFCLDEFDDLIPGGGAPGSARAFFINQIFSEIASARANLMNASPKLAPLIPAVPIVNSVCSQGSERAGVTLLDNSGGTGIRSGNPTSLDEQQIAALLALPLLPGREQFSVQVTAAALQSLLNSAWALLTVDNSRLDSDQNPDPKGSIELDNKTLTLGGDVVKLQIQGTYHTPKAVPNVPFQAVSTDTYSIQQVMSGALRQGVVSVASAQNLDANLHNLNLFEDAIEFIEGFVGGIFAASGIAYTQSYIQGQIASGLTGLQFNLSIGNLFQPVFVSEILIPDSAEKVAFSYDALTVDSTNGILASGTTRPSVVARVPSISIVGPGIVLQEYVGPGQYSAIGTYLAVTKDINAPTNIKWSGNATFVPFQNGPLQTTATFSTAGASQEHLVVKIISVSLTDDSGKGPFKASLAVSVGIARRVSPPKKPPILQPERPSPFQN
jgi:hypothetical protein